MLDLGVKGRGELDTSAAGSRLVPTFLNWRMGAAPAGGHFEKLDDGGLDFGLEGAAGSAVWLGSGLRYGFVFFVFQVEIMIYLIDLACITHKTK